MGLGALQGGLWILSPHEALRIFTIYQSTNTMAKVKLTRKITPDDYSVKFGLPAPFLIVFIFEGVEYILPICCNDTVEELSAWMGFMLDGVDVHFYARLHDKREKLFQYDLFTPRASKITLTSVDEICEAMNPEEGSCGMGILARQFIISVVRSDRFNDEDSFRFGE